MDRTFLLREHTYPPDAKCISEIILMSPSPQNEEQRQISGSGSTVQ